jgi:hypothetical protein
MNLTEPIDYYRFSLGIKKYGYNSEFRKAYESMTAQLRHDELNEFFDEWDVPYNDISKDYNFNENDWDHFHDVILDATYHDGKVDLNQEQMEQLFLELPEYLKNDAKKWGMNDTPWRDALHMWYKENKMNN